jgi:hypothetical protein
MEPRGAKKGLLETWQPARWLHEHLRYEKAGGSNQGASCVIAADQPKAEHSLDHDRQLRDGYRYAKQLRFDGIFQETIPFQQRCQQQKNSHGLPDDKAGH